MAYPLKDANEGVMNKIITLRVSDSEYNRIKEHSKLTGKTVTDFIKQQIKQTINTTTTNK